MTADESLGHTLQGTHGRDAGKLFKVREVPPLDMATIVLRLLSAIQLAGVDELLVMLRGTASGDADALETVLRMFAGSDPQAVRALMDTALSYVDVAPDPQHPGLFRPLRPDDICEMKTLGDVFGAFVAVNAGR